MLKLDRVSNPIAGIPAKVATFRARGDEPRIVVQTVDMGPLKNLWQAARIEGQITGAGTGRINEEASLPASVEAIERYCAAACSDDQFLYCSAAELGEKCLDLDSIPRCSDKELSHPDCQLVRPDKETPIRWVQALSLHTGEVKYVPAVMVYIYAGFANTAERIAFPITTGCAAHTSLEKALLNGILEVIERDAISLVWLQQLRLPKIDIDSVTSTLAPYWERYRRSARDLECMFFDATTDLGVPTVYGFQISRNSQEARTLVACSAALDASEGVAKVLRDMAAARIAFRRRREVPNALEAFTDIWHGATYMATAERAHAFNFLLESNESVALSQMHRIATTPDREALPVVLEILRRKGLEIYAVELSTDEALRAGLRVVKVLIPGLQPVGFHYRARYLGHQRLYNAPAKMGHKAANEDELNRWPQPFA